MLTGSDMFYSVMAIATFVIVASVFAGYLGSYAKNSISVVEGFEATEDTVGKLTENVSNGVNSIEESLIVDKYKDEYKKISSLTKDMIENMKLYILLDIKQINPKKDSPAKILNTFKSLANNLAGFDRAIKVLENNDIIKNGGQSSKKEGGWF